MKLKRLSWEKKEGCSELTRGRAAWLRRAVFAVAVWKPKRQNPPRVKYWEIIADNLSASSWSWGCVSAVDSHGRTIFVADAHRGDGQHFIVRADEKLTALVELESAIRGCGFSP